MLDQTSLQRLVNLPSESLTLELKDWFDVNTPAGQAKIVKACIALRNQDGGYLLIGFNDEDGSPSTSVAPSNVRTQFHVDVIQPLISQYASEAFEISVHFVELNGVDRVVVAVPAGIRIPIAAKRPILDQTRELIKEHRIYVRNLSTSGRPSSSEINWKDIPALMERCFENREADIGRFIRRHLTGLTRESLRIVSGDYEEPDDQDRVLAYMNESLERLKGVLQALSTSMPSGYWEVSAVLNHELTNRNLDQPFLNTVLTSNPNFTGWPIWLDTRNFATDTSRPRVASQAWEMIAASPGNSWGSHFDYWRIKPNGNLYHFRVFEDDIPEKESPLPGTAFDFGMAIARVAEAIAVALHIYRALSAQTETTIVFGFRCKGLAGRTISSWADHRFRLFKTPTAHEDEYFSSVVLPLDTPLSAIPSIVEELVQPLFNQFGGFSTDSRTIETITSEILSRRF